MKRFAAVAVLGLGLVLAGQAEAGKLPSPESMVWRLKQWRPAHGSLAKRPPAAPKAVDKVGLYRSSHPQR
jgi:hypothetical protein